MTAIQEMIEIIKQKRYESEISNTLLRFVHDEAIRLLEKEKKQQEEFAEWCDDNYFRIGTTSFWAESLFDEKAIAYKTEELLEIYKKTL